MSESKHTPGPWFVHVPRTLPEVIARKGAVTICKCRNGSLNDGLANARLIAAAPELYEALRKIDRINGSTGGPEAMVREFKHIARAALARAEGRES